MQNFCVLKLAGVQSQTSTIDDHHVLKKQQNIPQTSRLKHAESHENQ